MGNHIVVTRAPRFKIVQWGTLDEGTFFVGQDGQIMVRAHGTSNQNVDCSKRGIEEFWPERGFVHPFESFEAMCKWVSNGRRLEDLQGDANAEWVAFEEIPQGAVFTRINSFDTYFLKFSDGQGFELSFGDIHSFLGSTKVWPLNAELGDSITITAQP